MKLTPRQRQILDQIRTHLEATSSPPTRAGSLPHSVSFGQCGGRAPACTLRAKAIELLKGTSPGIRLLRATARDSLPVIGRVAAGSPILAEEHIEERYGVDSRLFHPRAIICCGCRV